MTPDELEDQFRRIAGQAYGEGIPAETVIDKINNVEERFELLAEVDK